MQTLLIQNFDYLVLINEALADAEKATRFCLIETGDQTAIIILLSDNQLKKVQEDRLLPLSEWQPW